MYVKCMQYTDTTECQVKYVFMTKWHYFQTIYIYKT